MKHIKNVGVSLEKTNKLLRSLISDKEDQGIFKEETVLKLKYVYVLFKESMCMLLFLDCLLDESIDETKFNREFDRLMIDRVNEKSKLFDSFFKD